MGPQTHQKAGAAAATAQQCSTQHPGPCGGGALFLFVWYRRAALWYGAAVEWVHGRRVVVCGCLWLVAARCCGCGCVAAVDMWLLWTAGLSSY
jgi:hypothetical protein